MIHFSAMEHSPQHEHVQQKLETGLDAMLEMNRRHVVESIKTNGVEASRELVSTWCDKAQGWVDEDKLNKTQVNRRLIIVDLGKADFYIAAGDTDDALDSLDATSCMAEHEGNLDLKEQAENKITEIISARKVVNY